MVTSFVNRAKGKTSVYYAIKRTVASGSSVGRHTNTIEVFEVSREADAIVRTRIWVAWITWKKELLFVEYD